MKKVSERFYRKRKRLREYIKNREVLKKWENRRVLWNIKGK